MGTYVVERSISVNAPPHRLHDLLDDFHAWTAWSPWEDLDPSMRRSYQGPESGVGARYEWSGNRKAGAGTMEIVRDTPAEVEIVLVFTKPFKDTSVTTFELTERGAGTEVLWRLTGEQKGVMSLFGKVFSMDKMIGRDFEKGLARLKAVAEDSAVGAS